MKHVVTGAPLRWRVLVTGFGPFPGAPTNPTAAILTWLERQSGRLARLGIVLQCDLLPVVYTEIRPALHRAVAAHQPDAILHLGLASRRRHLSVETRARNHAGLFHPDARGRLPLDQTLARGAAESLAATYAVGPVCAAIQQRGLPVRASIDAGDYVCNATLYLSLWEGLAAQVGFLHVPRARNAMSPRSPARKRKPTILALGEATLAVILVMRRRQLTRAPAAAEAAPREPRRGDAPEGRPRR